MTQIRRRAEYGDSARTETTTNIRNAELFKTPTVDKAQVEGLHRQIAELKDDIRQIDEDIMASQGNLEELEEKENRVKEEKVTSLVTYLIQAS
jgi:septal ring factor EnvC (AmiA/AmiB activator)